MKIFTAGLLAFALLGCSEPRPPTAVRAEAYTYEDRGGATARVFRAVGADGAEALHGETDLPAGGLRIVEDATLDAAGRLVRAEIRVTRGCDGAVEDHVVVDRARGLVRADTPGGVVTWPVTRDAPWAVAPARAAATPVTVWIAQRAAATGEPVRVIRPDVRSSYLAPAAQVAIGTETGTTVVLGEAAASADRAFVDRVTMLDRPLDLVRVERGAPAIACASLFAGPPDRTR